MVTVYFRNGHTARVGDAATAAYDMSFTHGGEAVAVAALVCKDKDGKVVAEFRLDDVTGYAIE
jgi:hypothetical protein